MECDVCWGCMTIDGSIRSGLYMTCTSKSAALNRTGGATRISGIIPKIDEIHQVHPQRFIFCPNP